MKQLIFATTNEGKLRETREILGVEIKGTPLEIDEIQSTDPVEVASKKALAYYNRLQKPLFVEDGSLTFNALKTLPGTYINDFSKALGNTGLVKLLKGANSRKAKSAVTIAYVDARKSVHTFVGVVKGTIVRRPRGKNGFGWDPIFVPDGHTKTFAQMTTTEKNKCSMRTKALKKFKKWLDSQSHHDD